MAQSDEITPFPVEKGSEEHKTPTMQEESWDFLHQGVLGTGHHELSRTRAITANQNGVRSVVLCTCSQIRINLLRTDCFVCVVIITDRG